MNASTKQVTSNDNKYVERKLEDDNSQQHGEVVEEKENEQEQTTKLGCGIMAKYPVTSLLLFVGLGIGIGIGLSLWTPDQDDALSKKYTLQWIGLIGDLFLRALTAVVLPIVFVNIVIAVVDMMVVGAAGGVGAKSIGLYLATTLMASIFGVIFASTFSRWFKPGEHTLGGDDSNMNSFITLGCSGGSNSTGNDEGSFLTQSIDGTVSCTTASQSDTDGILWNLNDVNNTFARNAVELSLDLSDTIYKGVFEKLITKNIFESLYDGNFAAIVVFAIALGVAAAKVMSLSKTIMKPKDTIFMSFLCETEQILSVMITWVISCTPFAILSMVAKAIGGQSNLGHLFQNVGLLVSCTLLGFLCHYLITYCGGYYLFTRKNPFAYLKHIVPAQLMAFACSSSAATIPVSIESVLSTGYVPETLARFIIPLGATINMDGTAIYFPVACIWLAIYNGLTPNIGNYVLLVIISTFGSMGAAPIPNAGLALIITTYNTVFGGTDTPLGFESIIAIDWLIDRGRTTLNVTGDTIVCGIISHLCPIDGINDNPDLQIKQGSSNSSSFKEEKSTSRLVMMGGDDLNDGDSTDGYSNSNSD